MKKVLLPRRRALILSGGALAAPMIASGVARAADDWPNKPVKYIVVFPAGGPTDTLSRIVCRELEKLTNQQFIIENRSGSGGVVGAETIARSAPDGYTIGLYTIAAHAIAPTLYAKLPFDAGKDFTGIAILWEVPNMLMTRLDFPANTVPELIALLKANPGKYSFASSGAGTSPQITGELFKSMAGVNILHVPYRGSAPAHQDILAGQVDMMFDNIPGPLGLMKGGKVKTFAVTSQGAPSGGARHADHGRVPAGLRDHLVGRHLRPGRPAAGDGRAALGPAQAGAGERGRQGGVRQAGRPAALAQPRRHGGLSRRQREAAGAGHQGIGREGGVIHRWERGPLARLRAFTCALDHDARARGPRSQDYLKRGMTSWQSSRSASSTWACGIRLPGLSSARMPLRPSSPRSCSSRSMTRPGVPTIMRSRSTSS